MKESAPAVLERRTLGCSREDGEGGRALSASAGIRSLQFGYRAIVRGRVLLMGGEEVFRCTVPRGTPSRGGDLQYEYLMIGRVNHQAYFALSDVDVARRVFWRNSVVRHADGDGATTIVHLSIGIDGKLDIFPRPAEATSKRLP